MKRLTSNKPIADMSIIELAYNSCYADKNNNARYRDYDLDIDSRELVRNLAKDICNEDLSNMSDEEFDEYIAEMLSAGIDSQIGLLALFYRNLWAMADLREKLKHYEDLEEQNKFLKLPCEIGDIAWQIMITGIRGKSFECNIFKVIITEISFDIKGNFKISTAIVRDNGSYTYCTPVPSTAIGDTIFFTKEEAEARLKEWNR